MLSPSWIWLCAGAVLMMLELATPGFVMFFFGLAAATTGVLTMILGEECFSSVWQLLSFSFFSVVYLLFLRRLLKKLFSGSVATSDADLESGFAGKIAIVTEEIQPPRHGRVMLGDAEWTAVSSSVVAKGANVRVVSRDNLTLTVEAV